MQLCKVISALGTIGALLLLSGYDCPECNYKQQTIALIICAGVAIVFGMMMNAAGITTD